MNWEVEYTESFGRWWASLTLEQRGRIDALVQVLERGGPLLGQARGGGPGAPAEQRLWGLRIEEEGIATEVLYRYDPARRVILLVEGTCKFL
ncbi:MAG: type II toxin-antitoxin system RelE/ParE family toxin [Longimicrobiales bacterium]